MRTDGRTFGRADMTKPIVAFCNFANAPKKQRIRSLKVGEEGIWKPVFQSKVFQDRPRLVISDAPTPATNNSNNIKHLPDHQNGQEHVGEDEGEVDGCH